MVLKKVNFILGENVPVKLKQVFTDHGVTCITVKEKGWIGLKNG